MKYYSLEAIEKLIQRYVDKGGEIVTIQESCLGYGKTLLHGQGLKTIIIEEVYLNDWSSTHKMRMYNKTPAKYLELAEIG